MHLVTKKKSSQWGRVLKSRRAMRGAASLTAAIVGVIGSHYEAKAAPTHTWTANASGNWTVGANWGGTAPTTGTNEILEFDGSSSTAFTATNDAGNPFTLNGVIFNNTGSGNLTTANASSNNLAFAANGAITATITQSGSTISIFDNSFTLNTNMAVSGSGTGLLLFGNGTGRSANLNANTLTIDNSSFAVTFSDTVTGSGSVVKTGTNLLTFGATTGSTFTGGLTVDGGRVALAADSLGFTTGNLTSGSLGNGTLTLTSGEFGGTAASGTRTVANKVIINGDVTLLGNGTAGIGVQNLTFNGNTSYTSPASNYITLTATANSQRTITVSGASSANIAAFIGGVTETNGNTGITKLGVGTLKLGSGEATANTFTGLVDVQVGEVDLGKQAGTNAIGGNAQVGGTSAVLKWLASNQIGDSASLTVNTGGSANLNTFSETIGNLTTSGNATVSGGSPSTLTISGAGTANIGSGTVSVANLVTGTGGIVFGSGALVSSATTLNGDVTFTGAGAGATFGTGVITLTGNRTFAIGDSAAVTSELAVTGNVTGTATAGNTQMLTFTGDGVSNGNITFGSSLTNGVITNGAGGGNVAITVNTTGGSVILVGNSTYTGSTNVQAGTLVVKALAPLTSTSAINLTSGVRLDLQVANGNLTKLSNGSGVVPGSFLRYSTDQGGSTTGPGTILGTLEINATQTAGTNTITLGQGSTMAWLAGNAVSTTSAISALGNFTLEGRTSTPTLAGNLIINGGAGNTTVLTGLVAGGSTLTVSGNVTEGTSKLAIVKTGNGTFSLTGTSTNYTGGSSILQGNLTVNGNATVGTGNISIGDSGGSVDAALNLNAPVVGATIAIPGKVTAASGSGNNTLAVRVTAANLIAFNGGLTLNNNLTLSGSTSSGSGSQFTTLGGVVINAGTNLTFTGTWGTGTAPVLTQVTGSGNITANLTSGSINIGAPGTPEAFSGNVILSATNSSTGRIGFIAPGSNVSSITINGGYVWATSATSYAYGNAAITVNNGGTLKIFETGATTNTFGGGLITLNSGGQFAIGGDNTAPSTVGNISFNGGFINASPNNGGSGIQGDGSGGSTRGLMLTSNNVDVVQGTAANFTIVGNIAQATTLAMTGNISVHGDTTFNLTGGNGSLIQLSSIRDLSPSSNANLTFNSTTSNGTLSAGFTLGTGNTLNGSVTVGAGKLRVSGNTTLSSLSATNELILNGSTTVDLSTFTAGVISGTPINQFTSSLTVAGLRDGSGTPGTSIIVGNTLGVNNNGGSIGNRTLTIGGSGSYAFSGSIIDRIGTGNNSLSLSKTGSGTQILSGANTYSGNTSITNGALLVNGTHTGGAAYTVGSTGTLGGNGTIGTTVSVASGGTVTGGSASTVGALTTGAITFNAGSTFAVNVNDTTNTPSDTADQLIATGAVVLTTTGAGTTLVLSFTSDPMQLAYGQSFVLIDNTSASTTTGYFTFAGAGTPVSNIQTFSASGLAGSINYAYAADGDSVNNDVRITFTSVPEPTSLSFLGLGAGGLLARRRRRRNRVANAN